jgi:CHAD domain-containing protein
MADPLELSPGLPVAEGVRQMLLSQLGEIQQQSRLVLEPDQPVTVAAVHDLRVALRKNIAVFDAFAPWLDPDWLKKARKGYAPLLKRLGKLRDLDILQAWLSQEAGDLEWLLELVDRDRLALRHNLPEHLQGRSFARWMGRQVAALALPESALRMNPVPVTARGEVQLVRLQDCLPVILYQASARLTAYRNLIPELDSLPPEIIQDPAQLKEITLLPDDILHRLRVAAKSFRYTLEVCQSLLGRPAKKLIKEFKSFQDLLGEWHDTAVALAYLEQLPAEQKKAARIAELHAGRLVKQEKLRSDFELRWKSMSPGWFYERLSACLDHAYALKILPESPEQPVP